MKKMYVIVFAFPISVLAARRQLMYVKWFNQFMRVVLAQITQSDSEGEGNKVPSEAFMTIDEEEKGLFFCENPIASILSVQS